MVVLQFTCNFNVIVREFEYRVYLPNVYFNKLYFNYSVIGCLPVNYFMLIKFF